MVASSAMVIWKPPSPTTTQTSASGRATLTPIAAVYRADVGQQFVQNLAEIPDQGNINFHVLVDFGKVDLHVDLFGVGCIGLEIARDPIVEAHAKCEQQVGFLDGVVNPGFAVHPHHAQVHGMRSWEGAQSEESEGYGNASALRKVSNLFHGA